MKEKFSISDQCLIVLENMAFCSYPRNDVSNSLATVTKLMEFCNDINTISGFKDDLLDVARLIRSYKAIADGISSNHQDYSNKCEVTSDKEALSGVRLCCTVEEWFDENNTEPEDYLFDIRKAMAALLQDDGAAQETKKELGGVFERISFLIEGLQAVMINNK